MAFIGPDPEFYSVFGFFILPLVLGGIYLFYLLVEWPAHLFARWASRWAEEMAAPVTDSPLR